MLDHQYKAGIDIAGDGELPRIGFSFYVKDRMSGFGGVAKRGTVTDFAKFPDFAALKLASGSEFAGGKKRDDLSGAGVRRSIVVLSGRSDLPNPCGQCQSGRGIV